MPAFNTDLKYFETQTHFGRAKKVMNSIYLNCVIKKKKFDHVLYVNDICFSYTLFKMRYFPCRRAYLIEVIVI